MTDTVNKLIPPADTLKRLGGCSRAKLYRLMSEEKGFPQSVHIGRSVYFVAAEIDVWVDTQLAKRNQKVAV